MGFVKYRTIKIIRSPKAGSTKKTEAQYEQFIYNILAKKFRESKYICSHIESDKSIQRPQNHIYRESRWFWKYRIDGGLPPETNIRIFAINVFSKGSVKNRILQLLNEKCFPITRFVAHAFIQREIAVATLI